MEEERQQRKPHLCPIQHKNLNNHEMFEPKTQNSDYEIGTRLLLKVVSDNLGLFCLLISSNTFLEMFLKILITEEIWSPLCLKKAKKKIGISAQ